MLKIKQIEFIKVVFDDSLSHNIFSIANITLSNYPPIAGALLYWQKNMDDEDYTPEGDYKFFYDMANVSYFASVKFPKHVRLTRDQKQELAYILLEERGSVGSYSFATHAGRKKNYPYEERFKELNFPQGFETVAIPPYIKSIVTKVDLEMILHDYPQYDPVFIHEYAKWRYQTAQLHPINMEKYLGYIDFAVICAINPHLSENYLIEHLPNVNFEMLASNYAVLSRLTEPFRQYMYTQLESELAEELREFLEADVEQEPMQEFLVPYEEEPMADYEFYEYDRGSNKWQGSEHLVKGIPSLAAQRYDHYGYLKYTNKEMDRRFQKFDLNQRTLLCYSLDLHWIHRYRDELNWTLICAFNPNLTDDFLTAHLKYVDFDELGNNTWCYLSEEFVDQHMNKFNHQQPVPLIIRHLSESLYIKHKDTIIVNSQVLHEYGDILDDEQFLIIQNIIEP